MSRINWQNAYLRLNPEAVLKSLEALFVYHIGRDELYEIDETAATFLRACDGTQIGRDLTSEAEFVEFCLEEGILEAKEAPDPIDVYMCQRIEPSLRYLELQLTHRCNLRCAHCYLGDNAEAPSLSLADAVRITREFAAMGGLRLLISGGEPLLYGELESYLRQISGLPIRRVLFTNGTLINAENTKIPDVHEIQFSLDGWTDSHDRLRGKGAFARTMEGVRIARDFGMPISFATMIHQYNQHEFDRMAAFMEDVGAVEWGVDALCRAGSLVRHDDYLVSDEECVPLMAYGFGGGYHGASEGWACGRHLMTVMPDGRAAKCGFYMDSPVGNAGSGLRKCWEKIGHTRLADLVECRHCPVVEDCRGGCRFRASDPLSPDPVMCRLYDI